MTLKLVSGVDRQQRVIEVDGPGDRPMPFLAQVDAELVLVTAGAGRISAAPYPDPASYLWTVERGANGTIAAAHAADVDVTPVAAIVTTTAPASPPVPASAPGTDLSPLTWDGQNLRLQAPPDARLAIAAGPRQDNGQAGSGELYGGDYDHDNGPYGGGITAQGAFEVAGGQVTVSGGNGEVDGASGGSLVLHAGEPGAGGTPGNVVMDNLPSEDPEVEGALFSVADALDALKVADPGTATAEDVATALNALIDALANTLQVSAG